MKLDIFFGKISQSPICEKSIDTNLSKKIFMFLFAAIVLIAAVSNVDAALCRGFDGYYHDCGYNYGQNSYGSSYGSGHGSSSYGKQSYGHSSGYSSGNYRNEKVVYANNNNNNNYKKYNPINNYYIYSGPGYQRTHRDDRYSRNGDVRVTYIKDARTYEHRPNVNQNGRQLSIRLIGAYGSGNDHSNVIRIGDGSWNDGDPYHSVRTQHSVRKLHYEGEEHCPDGFVCLTGSYY